MLLCYHWGHSVGHVYSHVTWTEAECHGNHASTPTKTHNPISELGDFEPDVDSGDQARASEIQMIPGQTTQQQITMKE